MRAKPLSGKRLGTAPLLFRSFLLYFILGLYLGPVQWERLFLPPGQLPRLFEREVGSACTRCTMTHTLDDPQDCDTATNPTLQASVVVPAYNSQATLDRCLKALERQTLPPAQFEIIVVDDGSTDDTCARIKAHRTVKLLTQRHTGPAAARNLGIEHAHAEVVLFTDADCEPAADWIEQMLAPLNDPQTVGAKGVYRTHQRALVARFVQMEYETRYARMASHMARSNRIDFIDTYAAAYRRDVLLANGGFDSTFATASVEDQELSFRIAEQGHRLVFAPQAVVYHWGHAASIRAYARKKFKIGYFKIEVLARHRDKVWQDAHTPQTLKAQILILALGVCCLVGGLCWSPLFWAAAGLGLFFSATTIPFTLRAWKHDPPIALISPFLILLRALALGSGMLAGMLSYLLRKATKLVTR